MNISNRVNILVKLNKNIKKYQKLHILIFVLLSITTVFLPVNIFRVWRTPDSYVFGHLVDYLAPKIYLSQVMIWCLWLISLIGTRLKALEMPKLARFLSWSRITLTFVSVTVISWLIWKDPSAVWWSFNFLTGPWLLLGWLVVFGKKFFRAFEKGLLLGVLIQGWLASYQYVWQRSFLPYFISGEPGFWPSANLAQSQLAQFSWKLPYASTPHPNILAFWLVIGILIIIKNRFEGKISNFTTNIWLILLSVPLWWSESWSAWLALLSAAWVLTCYLLYQKHRFGFLNTKKRKFWFLFALAVSLNSFGSLIPIWAEKFFLEKQAWQLLEVNSFVRRAELLRISGSFLLDQGWSPQGLVPTWQTYFQTIYLDQNSYQGSRFLQPAHNFFVIAVIFYKFWVINVLLFFRDVVYKYYSNVLLLFIVFWPVFSLDHYLLTTISGQFQVLILLYFLLSFNEINKPHN